MSPILYQLSGILPDGKYLPGQYQWPSARQLLQVLVNGRRPTSGTLKLYLEIGGVRSDFFISISAGTTSFTIARSLFAVVPARTDVRWQAVFDGAPEEAASQVALTLTLGPMGSVTNPALTVRDGGSGLVYYTYDPATHTFTDVVPAGITPLWALAQVGDALLTLSIQGAVALRVAAGVVTTKEFYALGGTQTVEAPRAVFYVGNVPVASLTQDIFRVADGFEVDAPVLTLSPLDGEFYHRFEFWSGGVLTAALNGAGLEALSLVESTTP